MSKYGENAYSVHTLNWVSEFNRYIAAKITPPVSEELLHLPNYLQHYGYRSTYKAAHPAIDLAVKNGTPLYAIYDGEVIAAVPTLSSTAGRYIFTRHKIGKYSVVCVYMHLTKLDVKKGDKITKGQKIGSSGSSGTKETSYAPHLHFEIYASEAKTLSTNDRNYRKSPYSVNPTPTLLYAGLKKSLNTACEQSREGEKPLNVEDMIKQLPSLLAKLNTEIKEIQKEKEAIEGRLLKLIGDRNVIEDLLGIQR